MIRAELAKHGVFNPGEPLRAGEAPGVPVTGRCLGAGQIRAPESASARPVVDDEGADGATWRQVPRRRGPGRRVSQRRRAAAAGVPLRSWFRVQRAVSLLSWSKETQRAAADAWSAGRLSGASIEALARSPHWIALAVIRINRLDEPAGPRVLRGVIPAQIAALTRKHREGHPAVCRLVWPPCPCGDRDPGCKRGYVAPGARRRSPGSSGAGGSNRTLGGPQ